MLVAKIVNQLFTIYWWLVIIRIFLTWIPSIDWFKQPFATLKAIVDPFLMPFSRLIPPLGGLDFSPIIAILALQFIQVSIVRLLVVFGL